MNIYLDLNHWLKCKWSPSKEFGGHPRTTTSSCITLSSRLLSSTATIPIKHHTFVCMSNAPWIMRAGVIAYQVHGSCTIINKTESLEYAYRLVAWQRRRWIRVATLPSLCVDNECSFFEIQEGDYHSQLRFILFMITIFRCSSLFRRKEPLYPTHSSSSSTHQIAFVFRVHCCIF